MGELLPNGGGQGRDRRVDDSSDRVIGVVGYPPVATDDPAPAGFTRLGYTHIGLTCDDVARTRADLLRKGVGFIVDGIADLAGVRTT